MTDAEYAGKLDELDRLLNDPDLPMQPQRIWDLLADISHRDLAGTPDFGWNDRVSGGSGERSSAAAQASD
jgi:hypothetical protein